MTTELLPCPFCGSTELYADRYYVVCENCDTYGPSPKGSAADITEADIRAKEAVKLWNTRAQSSRALQELARYFTSGNAIQIERAIIKADDFWRISGLTCGPQKQ